MLSAEIFTRHANVSSVIGSVKLFNVENTSPHSCYDVNCNGWGGM